MPTKSKRKSRGSAARGGVKSLALLRELEELHTRFDADSAERKLELLGALSSIRLTNAKQVQRLHEVLCFLRALPDDQTVLQQVETMLSEFAERTDLRRFRSTLADSGIAGTDVHFSFYSTTARWLTQHCGLTNANIHAFAPIPLTLVQIETGKGTGIKPIRRVVVASAVETAPLNPPGPVVSPPVPAAAVGEPPIVGDEVPF